MIPAGRQALPARTSITNRPVARGSARERSTCASTEAGSRARRTDRNGSTASSPSSSQMKSTSPGSARLILKPPPRSSPTRDYVPAVAEERADEVQDRAVAILLALAAVIGIAWGARATLISNDASGDWQISVRQEIKR